MKNVFTVKVEDRFHVHAFAEVVDAARGDDFQPRVLAKTAASQEFVFYIHPWEVDPGRPRIERAGLVSRLRHYQDLMRCSARLRLLLANFEFTTMRAVLLQKGLIEPGV